jgi:hypothetical protein
MKRMFQMM